MKVRVLSPTAARMRSRSRAVSTVPRYGRIAPLAFWQLAANCWSWVISAVRAAAPTGTGSGSDAAVVVVPPVLPQVTGSLRCVPRGSKVHDVEVVEHGGCEGAQLVGEVVDARHPRAAWVDHQRSDPLGRYLRRMPLDGDADGGSFRIGVVEGHGDRPALEPCPAGGPLDRSHRQRGRGGRRRRGGRGGRGGGRHARRPAGGSSLPARAGGSEEKEGHQCHPTSSPIHRATVARRRRPAACGPGLPLTRVRGQPGPVRGDGGRGARLTPARAGAPHGQRGRPG